METRHVHEDTFTPYYSPAERDVWTFFHFFSLRLQSRPEPEPTLPSLFFWEIGLLFSVVSILTLIRDKRCSPYATWTSHSLSSGQGSLPFPSYQQPSRPRTLSMLTPTMSNQHKNHSNYSRKIIFRWTEPQAHQEQGGLVKRQIRNVSIFRQYYSFNSPVWEGEGNVTSTATLSIFFKSCWREGR